MVDPDVVAARLARLRARAERARELCPDDAEALAGDEDALDLVSFNLMVAVQSALDVASHLIADEGWEPASSLAGAFDRLAAQDVLSGATADAMRRAAGLRNVVAHAYGVVDPEIVWRAAREGVDDLEAFAAEVAAWLRSRA